MHRWTPTIWLLVAFTLGVFAARLTNAPIVIKLYGSPLGAASVTPPPARPRLPITSL